MSLRGTFPEFVKTLRRQWKAEIPGLSGIGCALGAMPKASTFYAGIEPIRQRHVFVWVQASVKRPGEFTVNIVLSDEEDGAVPGRPAGPAVFTDRATGSYRIGHLVGGGDKWWSIAPKTGLARVWAAVTSLHREDSAFEPAITDVTRDVKKVLLELGLPNNNMQLTSPARTERRS